MTTLSPMSGTQAQGGSNGSLTILAALCPPGYVGNASADECDNSPLPNIPFRLGIPSTEAFTNDVNTGDDGIVRFDLFPSDQIRIIEELPPNTTRYVVYCVDGSGNELNITYPADASGNQALGIVDVSVAGATEVLCDFYNVPFLPIVQATKIPDQAKNCATAETTGDVSQQVAMDGGNAARTGEQPGTGPKGIPLLDEAFLHGLRAPIGETAVYGIRTKEGTPILAADGVAYIGGAFNAPGSDSLATSGTTWGLLALNTDGSGVRWFAPLYVGAEARGYLGTPTIANGAVYISTPGELISLDAATGAQRWKVSTEAGGFSSPVEVDGVLYTTSGTGVASAFDSETGQERWHLWLGDWSLTEPAVVDGVVYVGGSDGSLYALDGKSGKPIWRHEADGPVYVGPAIADGLAYITTDAGTLSAIDLKNGRERWRVALSSQSGSTAQMIVPSATVARGTVYVGGRGVLLAFDASTGHPKWLLVTDGSAMSSPSIAGGTIYSVSLDGHLYAVDGQTGVQQWSYDTPAEGPFGADGSPEWLPAPSIANGTVYFTNVHGWIYAVTGS